MHVMLIGVESVTFAKALGKPLELGSVDHADAGKNGNGGNPPAVQTARLWQYAVVFG
jgi:hypothetical protein